MRGGQIITHSHRHGEGGQRRGEADTGTVRGGQRRGEAVTPFTLHLHPKPFLPTVRLNMAQVPTAVAGYSLTPYTLHPKPFLPTVRLSMELRYTRQWRVIASRSTCGGSWTRPPPFFFGCMPFCFCLPGPKPAALPGVKTPPGFPPSRKPPALQVMRLSCVRWGAGGVLGVIMAGEVVEEDAWSVCGGGGMAWGRGGWGGGPKGEAGVEEHTGREVGRRWGGG